MSAELIRLLRGDAAPAGRGTSFVMGGLCTAWNGTTYANAVSVGETDYDDLPVLAGAVATMGTGTVLVIFTPTGPYILGRILKAT